MKDKREVKQWITFKGGRHIPIFEGQTKEDAIKQNVQKKAQTRKSEDVVTSGNDSVSEDTPIVLEPDKKMREVARNKVAADKAAGRKTTQQQHKEIIARLLSPEFAGDDKDGTYDITTFKDAGDEMNDGFQVTFYRIGDNYSDEEYEALCMMMDSLSDGKRFAGRFTGEDGSRTCEISWHFSNRAQAEATGHAYGQESVLNWKELKEHGFEHAFIPTGGTGRR